MAEQRFAVRDPEMEALLRTVSGILKQTIPPPLGFALFLFELNSEQPNIFYLSSAHRADMLMVLKAFIESEGRKEIQ